MNKCFSSFLLLLISALAMSSTNACDDDSKPKDLVGLAMCKDTVFHNKEAALEYLNSINEYAFTFEYKHQIGDINEDGQDDLVLTGMGCNKNCAQLLLVTVESGLKIVADLNGGRIGIVEELPSYFFYSDRITKLANELPIISIYSHAGIDSGATWYYFYNGKEYIRIGSVNFNYSGIMDLIL